VNTHVPIAEDRTVVFYDARHRGKSDAVADPPAQTPGVERDVEDLETVRRHLGLESIDLIGHSYIGLMVALYTRAHARRVRRLVQIGPMPPAPKTQYPTHLKNEDETYVRVLSDLASMQNDPKPDDPVERCEKFWSILSALYVADPGDAHRARWGRCDQPNERNAFRYWMTYLMPSLQQVDIRPDDVAHVRAPALIVHGTMDRSSPYGGALDWARTWPHARLLTVEQAAHAPWIESPGLVFDGIRRFLDEQLSHSGPEGLLQG
jgi:pimeloyl-ACP methyl ester carboxylesterase